MSLTKEGALEWKLVLLMVVVGPAFLYRSISLFAPPFLFGWMTPLVHRPFPKRALPEKLRHVTGWCPSVPAWFWFASLPATPKRNRDVAQVGSWSKFTKWNIHQCSNLFKHHLHTLCVHTVFIIDSAEPMPVSIGNHLCNFVSIFCPMLVWKCGLLTARRVWKTYVAKFFKTFFWANALLIF